VVVEEVRGFFGDGLGHGATVALDVRRHLSAAHRVEDARHDADYFIEAVLRPLGNVLRGGKLEFVGGVLRFMFGLWSVEAMCTPWKRPLVAA